MKNIFTKLTFALFCLILFVPANAQISEGGIPPGMNGVGAKSAVVPTYEMPVDFDVAKLLEEDILLAEDNMPPRCGVVMPLSMNLIEHGTKISLPDGQEIIQLKIEANDALAIMLLYDKFIIPKGGKLFIYNSERNHILGA
ncbi:hypothetical protein LJC06_01500, partial [Bacteroidales bacterium OttesenSCG-928-I14]|nr:hypothetical protein [Bacteroidales bacterium OttesenSCG-928-I14]